MYGDRAKKVDPKLREVVILVNGRQERDSRNKGTNVFVQVQVVLDTSQFVGYISRNKRALVVNVQLKHAYLGVKVLCAVLQRLFLV